jgi:hypothetical protein
LVEFVTIGVLILEDYLINASIAPIIKKNAAKKKLKKKRKGNFTFFGCKRYFSLPLHPREFPNSGRSAAR